MFTVKCEIDKAKAKEAGFFFQTVKDGRHNHLFSGPGVLLAGYLVVEGGQFLYVVGPNENDQLSDELASVVRECSMQMVIKPEKAKAQGLVLGMYGTETDGEVAGWVRVDLPSNDWVLEVKGSDPALVRNLANRIWLGELAPTEPASEDDFVSRGELLKRVKESEADKARLQGEFWETKTALEDALQQSEETYESLRIVVKTLDLQNEQLEEENEQLKKELVAANVKLAKLEKGLWRRVRRWFQRRCSHLC